MDNDWARRWFPSSLLTGAGIVYGFILVQLLVDYPSIVDQIERFQTLIAGLLAVIGVWWTLTSHRQRQQMSLEHERSVQLRSMVVSIYHDLFMFAGSAVVRRKHAIRALELLDNGGELGADTILLLEDIHATPSIDYWRPQLGLWEKIGQKVLAFLQFKEVCQSAFSRGTLTRSQSDRDRVENAVKTQTELFATARDLCAEIARDHGDILEPIALDFEEFAS